MQIYMINGMVAGVDSVTVFPGTATILFVSLNYSCLMGNPPVIYYELWDIMDNPTGSPPTMHNVMTQGTNMLTTTQASALHGTSADQIYIMDAVIANLGLTATGTP